MNELALAVVGLRVKYRMLTIGREDYRTAADLVGELSEWIAEIAELLGDIVEDQGPELGDSDSETGEAAVPASAL